MPALDLEEWLQEIRMLACRYPARFPEGSADFALEALDMLDSAWQADAYAETLEGLERITEQKFPNAEPDEEAAKHLDWIEAELAAHESHGEAMADALEILSDAAQMIEQAGKAFTELLPKPPQAKEPGALEFDL